MILAALMTLVVVLDALRLRSRAARLRVLPTAAQESPPEGGPLDSILPGDTDSFSLFSAPGVNVGGEWAVGSSDLVDLVPPDLPTRAALDLLSVLDPAKYADDRWARGVSAGQALLVRSSYARPFDVSDPTEFTVFVRGVKEHVAARVDVAVAPGLRAGAFDLAQRAARLRQAGKRPALSAVFVALGFAAALFSGWPWALVVGAAYVLHPLVVFLGTPLRPRDLLVSSLLRPVLTPYEWVRTLPSRWRSTGERAQTARLAEVAPWYTSQLELGISRFFESRRTSCPACGSTDLRQWVRATDLVQRKPGSFTMDRCVRCGHVWQNPRLTEEGLGFYYRDFYDGLGSGAADAVFSGKVTPYYGRARMVQPFTTPSRWLDVGSGHAHFCLGAQEVLPSTQFDGLDQGADIEDAARLGRITRAYRGSFKDHAPDLRGQYDVISMHHYLEHVRDPWEELDIAADVLPSGGYLLIELPDPEWRLGRLFGQYWMPWFQPQHQHMMPIGNLCSELSARGLVPVATERSEAHMCNDFVLAVLLLLGSVAPRSVAPWRPGVVRLRLLRSFLVWTLGIPLFFVAAGLDQTLNRFLAWKTGQGNAYRVLARKEAS